MVPRAYRTYGYGYEEYRTELTEVPGTGKALYVPYRTQPSFYYQVQYYSSAVDLPGTAVVVPQAVLLLIQVLYTGITLIATIRCYFY